MYGLRVEAKRWPRPMFQGPTSRTMGLSNSTSTYQTTPFVPLLLFFLRYYRSLIRFTMYMRIQ